MNVINQNSAAAFNTLQHGARHGLHYDTQRNITRPATKLCANGLQQVALSQALLTPNENTGRR